MNRLSIMAIQFPVSFPIFAQPLHSSQYPDPNANSPAGRPLTEIRFARWATANAEKFKRHRRSQEEREDDARRYRRVDSAAETATISGIDSAAATSETETFKSGRKFKYSKTPDVHPAFRRISKSESRQRDPKVDRKEANVKLSDDGLSYVIDGAPFEFKYSYTETPKVKPVKLREPPFTPFGPVAMPRPWTGRAPLPPSKKKLKEFDSFVLPPPNKKGVKPVQKPGPFLPGTAPRYVQSREEIFGEPLTKQEINELIESCKKSERQLNMGRDGLTHNMLDNIHAHWKRRRVCKIKCKGVCTVDMDNVCEQLEEKTGGKIIYRAGGVLYLFRGRNYNYKTRPRFPLMLWKPVTPVYPKLIKRAPEGLTFQEAAEMRKKGRNLIPICKLAKNGVYCHLVKNVREAFTECELVRINCQGLNKNDYRKIGGKLKDLVPCVLLSFEFEHILMWRGDNWQPLLGKPETNIVQQEENNSDASSVTAGLNSQEVSLPCLPMQKDPQWASHSEVGSEIVLMDQKDLPVVEKDNPDTVTDATSSAKESNEISDNFSCYNDDERENIGNVNRSYIRLDDTNLSGVDSEDDCVKTSDCTSFANEESAAVSLGTNNISKTPQNAENQSESFDLESPVNQKGVDASESLHDAQGPTRTDADYTQRILFLMKEAVESGSAVVLDDEYLDADRVYQLAVAFARSAPPGPVFRHHLPKSAIQKLKKENRTSELKSTEKVQKNRSNAERSSKKAGPKIINAQYLDVVPKGTLGVDELAKLLA